MWGPRRTMNHLDQPQAADPRRQLIPSVGNPAFNYGSRSLSALVPAHSLFVIVPPAATPTIPPELNGAELQINALPWVFFNAETSMTADWEQRERERERERGTECFSVVGLLLHYWEWYVVVGRLKSSIEKTLWLPVENARLARFLQ